MPTIRGLYKFDQYRDALQKFAFKHAVETLSKLPEQEKPKKIKHESSYGTWYTDDAIILTIKAKGPELTEVEVDPYHFTFRLRMVSVSYKTYGSKDHWHFDVEEKIYTDSNHSSKLHYDGSSPEDKKKQIELINAFVSKLMEGIEPEPRFDLSKFHRTAKPNAVAS